MSEIKLTVHPFRMGTDKDAANKVLEEASEAREAAQNVRYCKPSGACRMYDCHDDCDKIEYLADEIADCIQACCNLADRYSIDLCAALQRVEEKNRERGRYE